MPGDQRKCQVVELTHWRYNARTGTVIRIKRGRILFVAHFYWKNGGFPRIFRTFATHLSLLKIHKGS